MRNLIFIFLFLPALIFGQNGINTPIKAFPTADGPGQVAVGGRGRALAIINTLDEKAALSGPLTNGNGEPYYIGGLWAALQNDAVGYIVWNVSGYHELTRGTGSNTSGTSRDFSIPLDGSINGIYGVHHKTLFGQSAPQGGITFSGGQLRFGGWLDPVDNDNIVIRYIRSRPLYDRYGNIPATISDATDDSFTWALSFLAGDSVVVDHCSFSWSWDKNLGGASRPETVPHTLSKHTYQFNLVGDAHTNTYSSVNPDLAGDPELYMNAVSYLRNVIFSANRTPNMSFNGDGEIINNVIYNIQYKYTRSYHDLRLRHVNNYYHEVTGDLEFNWIQNSDASVPRIHSSGNRAIGTVNRDNQYVQAVNFNGTPGQLNKEFWTDTFQGTANLIDDANWSATDFTFAWDTNEWTAQQAWDTLVVAKNVGAYKYLDDDGYVQVYRDTYDTNVLSKIENLQADVRWQDPSTWLEQKPVLPNNVRPANYDTDNDGMADAWEIRVYGNLSQGYGGDFDGDGYENIEEYMMQVDGVTGGSPPNPGTGNRITNDRHRQFYDLFYNY